MFVNHSIIIMKCLTILIKLFYSIENMFLVINWNLSIFIISYTIILDWTHLLGCT